MLTLFADVCRLRPGHLLSLRRHEAPHEQEWGLVGEVVLAGMADRVPNHREVLTEPHALLRDAVSRRTVSDVPIGAFLSRGIDSSLWSAHAGGFGRPGALLQQGLRAGGSHRGA